MGLVGNAAATYANQWFERTLDDSAIRRMDLPQAFLLCDAILKLFANITEQMVVYPKQIERHLLQELPFMATEKILMACVEKGESRQEMHEVVKVHSVEAGRKVKLEGGENDLLARLGKDDKIPFTLPELQAMIADFTQFSGRAAQQTEEYLEEVVLPRLQTYRHLLGVVDTSLAV